MPISYWDIASTIANCVIACATLLALWIAYSQLTNLNETLKMNGLTAIISLESEMNERKESLDRLSAQIQQLAITNPSDEAGAGIMDGLLQGALQNYLNAADRLAFCIKGGYFPEREWRTEYREYFSNIIRSRPDKFGPGTPYRNLLDLNHKWSRE